MSTLELVPIDLTDARTFIRQHHRHNPKMRGWRVGVGLSNGELRGVAVLSRPISKELQLREPRTAEIIRTCTLGDKNANSRLYGAMARAAASARSRRLRSPTPDTRRTPVSAPTKRTLRQRIAAVSICRRRGHLPPTLPWYSPDAARPQPCRRCGKPTRPDVDMRGHP